MPRPKQTGGPEDIARRIQEMVAHRQQLADELASVDAALAQIEAAMHAGGRNGRMGPGRPPKHQAAGAAPAAGRRKRGSYAQTAAALILEMAGQKGGATTAEIKGRWKAEGRGGTADKAISKLVKARKLKRAPLGEGQRGSRFTVA